METSTAVAIVGVGLANTVAFGAVLLKLGVLSQRLELVWEWYLIELGPAAQHNRRRNGEPRDGAGSGGHKRRAHDAEPPEGNGHA